MIYYFEETEIQNGTKHDFLGKKIVINKKDKTVAMEIKDQIQKMLDRFKEKTSILVDETVSTPVTKNWMKVNLTASELDGWKSKLIYTNTAKLLYIMKPARPDIETSVWYLMRLVSNSDNEDWMKLRRVLGFLKKTIDNTRKIRAKSLSNLFT